MNERIKIVLVSPLPPPEAGIANWTAALLREIEKRDDISAVAVDTKLQWRSITDFSLIKRLIGGSLQAFCDAFQTYKAIKKNKPHLVHHCTSVSLSAAKDILILSISKLLKVPSVIHIRMGRLPAIISSNTWEWKMIRIAMKKANTVILLDKKSEDAVTKALPSVSIRRIPNPIDLKMVNEVLAKGKKRRSGIEVYNIVFIGHVLPTKGIYELVKACLLIEEFQIKLDIVGAVKDEIRLELVNLASQRVEGKWLEIHGNMERHEAMSFNYNSDLFVFPSYTEGFPNAVVEAMALGMPIIAARVGAIPEMLGDNTDNPCGLLIDPQNVPELREAICLLQKDPGTAKIFGDRARKKAVEEYSMEKVMKEYMDLWHSIGFKP